MKIKFVYSFNVMDELKAGNNVFYIDYQSNTITNCNDLSVGALFDAINSTEKLQEENPSLTIFFKKGDN